MSMKPMVLRGTNRTIDRLMGFMSPTTLASFIADVGMLGASASREAIDAERKAREALVCLVGEEEAKAALNAIVGPECPECKESDLWIDDDTVRCSGCGLEFIP